jgi:hypothetical protein
MKKLQIIIAVIIVTVFGYLIFNNQNKHKCNWEDCPINTEYKAFTDAWCIKEIHIGDPKKTYEECEYILNVDCKDTTIN